MEAVVINLSKLAPSEVKVEKGKKFSELSLPMLTPYRAKNLK